MNQFEQQTLGTFQVDHEYELFVKAWMAYHRAANEVDGHLPPGHPEQRVLGRLAVNAGSEAMRNFLSSEQVTRIRNDVISYKRWNEAKMESLRRLGLK